MVSIYKTFELAGIERQSYICGAESGKVFAGSHKNQAQSSEDRHDKEAFGSAPYVQDLCQGDKHCS